MIIVRACTAAAADRSLEGNTVLHSARGGFLLATITTSAAGLDCGRKWSEGHRVVHHTLRTLLRVSTECLLSHPLRVGNESRYAFHFLKSVKELGIIFVRIITLVKD